MRYTSALSTLAVFIIASAVPLRAEVTFDFIGNTSLIVVPVSINGQGPYRFLLDTGANNTVLSAAVADSLKIPHR
jgi:Aspartyl protease